MQQDEIFILIWLQLVYTIKILKISVFYAIFGHRNGKIPDFKTSLPTIPEF